MQKRFVPLLTATLLTCLAICSSTIARGIVKSKLRQDGVVNISNELLFSLGRDLALDTGTAVTVSGAVPAFGFGCTVPKEAIVTPKLRFGSVEVWEYVMLEERSQIAVAARLPHPCPVPTSFVQAHEIDGPVDNDEHFEALAAGRASVLRSGQDLQRSQ